MLLASFLALYVAGDAFAAEEDPVMANSYYSPSGNPLTRSLSNSAALRAEFNNLQAGFDRLPDPLVGTKGFSGGQFTNPQITGAFITGSNAWYNGSIYADRLACHWAGATFASPGAVFPTNGIFGVYRTEKANSPFSMLVSAASVTDDYLLFDKFGNVVFGNGTAAKANADTNGFMMIPKSVSIPTGVPANTYASSVPLVYDGTNNKLYVYNGAWRSTAALT